jgi:RNA polymerase sigma factor (sigma-70 family)
LAQAQSDDLLSAARSGDSQAFHSIYADLAPRVLGYLKARGTEDAEASMQDVFLTLFTRLRSIRGGYQGLCTFVFSVAHARYVDEVRRRARRPYMSSLEPDADVRSADSAETVALGALGGSRVGQLLELLNAEQREVLLLRVVADLSLEQVAEITGRTTGAVKQLQRRGLLRLKKLAEREESLV